MHLPGFLQQRSELTFNHDEIVSYFNYEEFNLYVFHSPASPLSLTLFRGEKENEGGTTIHSA